MSLVMAAVCTDGIIVSGDFRRSISWEDPDTGKLQVGKYFDDQHKLIRTKSNRIIGATGNMVLKNGQDVYDAIMDALFITELLDLPMYEEFKHLVACVKEDNVSLLEAGMIDGKNATLIWTPEDHKIFIDYTGGAIGATEVLDECSEQFKVEKAGLNIQDTEKVLKKYNKLTALENRTVSPECEVFIIKN